MRELGERRILENHALGTGAERLLGELGARIPRVQEQAGAWSDVMQVPCGLDPAEVGHRDVEQGDIRLMLGDLFEGLSTVYRASQHADALLMKAATDGL